MASISEPSHPLPRFRSDLVAAGHRLECERVGASLPGKPTLVFLHEGLGSVSAWREFPSELAKATGLGALVYSRWGYGASDPLTAPREVDFMHDEARLALPAVLAQANVDDAILVGHSDGASIALIYAGEIGKRVRGLVLEAPHVFVEDVCIAAIAAARDTYETSGLRGRMPRHHADPDGAFRGWADVWLRPEFRAWNIQEVVPRVRVPTFVIQGEDDAYGTIAQVDAITANALARAERLILPDCGHSPHRDQKDATLAAMTRFIAELAR